MNLSDLKAGDPVIYDGSRYGADTRTVRPIARVTETQIILERPSNIPGDPFVERFDRKSGYIKGATSGYGGRTRIIAGDEAEIQKVKDLSEQRNLAFRFSNTNWKSTPLELLRAVAEVLKGQP